MNSKAIKRQLLAAIAMVLVAALALGSSTYAWFVASGTVTAEGMSVQAQAEGNLVIRYKLDTWSTVATAEPSTTVSLLPASTDNLSNWVYSKATLASAHDSDGTYTNLVTKGKVDPTADNNTEATKSDYVMIRKFQVRSATASEVDASKGLFVNKITVTIPSEQVEKDLSTALRVGVRCGDTSLIFGPVGTPQYGKLTNGENSARGVHVYENSSASSVTGKEVTLALTGYSGTTPNNTLYRGTIPIEVNKAVDVFIYVWYEGEDTRLFSDNYIAQNLSVSVELSSISSINPAYTVPATPPANNGGSEAGGTGA